MTMNFVKCTADGHESGSIQIEFIKKISICLLLSTIVSLLEDFNFDLLNFLFH